jgi:hypothetical protein
MSEYLLFWPKAAVAGYTLGSGEGNGAIIYTKALPTNGFTEVVVQFQSDVKPSSMNGNIKVTPQVSNDGINWKDNTDETLNTLSNGSTVPFQDTKKFTTIAAFMRMRINLYDGSGANLVAGTIMVSGAGRS